MSAATPPNPSDRYELLIMPAAVKQLAKLDKITRERIDVAILRLADGLDGDVKQLVHHDPRYRLRVGDYRILFNVNGQRATIHAVLHRKDAYRK